MAELYARYVRAGKRTLESVPERWRADVEAILEKDQD